MPDPELPCEAVEPTTEGRALIVSDDENCARELVQENEDNYPAVPIAYSSTKVVLADGSAEFPFELPHLQTQVGGSFTKMLIQASDGTWYAFTPTTQCLNQRLIVVDGAFTFEDDLLPEIILAELCEITSCEEFDFILGVVETTIDCGDEEDQAALRLVLVPKALCPTCVEEV